MNKTNINLLYKAATGSDENITDIPSTWRSCKDIVFSIEIHAPDHVRGDMFKYLSNGSDGSYLWEWMEDFYKNYVISNFANELHENKNEYRDWLLVIKRRKQRLGIKN